MWKPSSNLKVACLVSLILCIPVSTLPQTGSSNEPVRYVGGVYVDLDRHDGRLRPAIGVENHQVMRANRTHPELGDGFGWTYNHASMLAYWNGRFYLEFLSNPVGEHRPPGHTVVVISTDGRNWGMPTVVFPPYVPPEGTVLPPQSLGYMMHQRMGFYVAPDGRLLVLGFYGHAPDPFNKGGIGRVVREVYKDGTYGPIYFIRYGSLTDWTESNTSYPWYTRSKDEGFVAACNALLANKLMISQWRDEDRGPEDFQPLKGPCSAVSFYHRKDGKAVGLCKEAYSVLSSDEGKTWTTPVISRTVITNNAKVWGQRTKDGRYALAYNPVHYGSHRWPLVIVTGEDGILFDDMLLVHGDVPPRRFIGNAKDFGPQYFRGIAEGNGSPPGNDMWLTYSVNKEDIWVGRIPVPVRYKVEGPVNDRFDNMQAGGKVLDWNIYNPKWASVGVVEFPSAANKSLELQDKDPYDYAKAVRVFAESQTVNLSCKVLAKQADTGRLEIEVVDRYGNRPVRLMFADDGQIKAMNGGSLVNLQAYKPNTWYKLDMTVKTQGGRGTYSVSVDGKRLLDSAEFAEAALTVERLSFRTGPLRTEPTRNTDRYDKRFPDFLPNSDDPVRLAVYNIDDVAAKPQ